MPDVSLARMWEQIDRDRQDAAALANVAMAKRAQAQATGDSEGFETFDVAARRHRRRAICLTAVQTLIGRVEKSDVIRREIARLEAAEKAEAEAAHQASAGDHDEG